MKLVPLTKGYFAKVDDEDYDRVLSCGSWYANEASPDMFYAAHTAYKNGKTQKIMMHRFIMDAQPGLVVDHINHDTLDNQKKNLRLCSHQENLKNRKNKRKGYFFSAQFNKWIVNENNKYGGRYNTREEAEQAVADIRNGKEREKQMRKRPMLPKGVRLMKNCNKRPFGAVVKEKGKQIYLGWFETVEEADKAYKEYWEKRNAI